MHSLYYFFFCLFLSHIFRFPCQRLHSFRVRLQLTWYDDDGDEIKKGVEKTEELLSDGKRFTVKSTLKFQALSEHHNATYTCRSKSAADKVTKNAEIKIEVIGLHRIEMYLRLLRSVLLHLLVPIFALLLRLPLH